MTNDEQKYQAIIDKKCPQCFRKDDCMCLPSQRATLCLGPFKDHQDWGEKIRADNEKDEAQADFRAHSRKKKLDEYLLRKAWFDYGPDKSDEND